MITKILLLLFILPCVLSIATVPVNRLFQNTLRRWEINILNDRDRSERWNRFINAKATVDRDTKDVVLESLNRFTVLNNDEYERIVGPFRRALNSTKVSDFVENYNSRASRQKRQYVDVDIPDTYNYWEEEVGLNTPGDQYGCGSCWSFPTVGTIEALYKEYTGEMVEFSQQYFVDCTFAGDGCGGGEINDGYRVTAMRQYMLSQDAWPYWGSYRECQFTDDIPNFTNNALTKLWVGDSIGLSTNENAFLSGLQYSPVAFGSYVSNNIFDYSGGTWTDSSCSSDPNAHAMLLVGYTETTLRIKASYGSTWGDGGYADYERGTVTLDSCNFYKDAYALRVSYRQELEYEYCNGSSVVTYGDCKASCEEMGAGWTLAVIPTLYHNQLLVDMLEEAYPGVKSSDHLNVFWMGLKDPEKDSTYEWADGSSVSYTNMTENVGKYGMLDKNTGYWSFKNSLTYEARGLCSRATSCRNISTSVQYGLVTFDNAALPDGTIATVSCDDGGTPQGESELTCTGGAWSADLPSCTVSPGSCVYNNEAGSSGKLSPDNTLFSDGDEFTITCNTDGSSTDHTCNSGSIEPGVELCPAADGSCELLNTAGATLVPDQTQFEEGEQVTVTCNEGNSTGTFTCVQLAFSPAIVDVEEWCSAGLMAGPNIAVIVVVAGAICALFS